jgi:DNA-binding CsgD family transcriptional regulator
MNAEVPTVALDPRRQDRRAMDLYIQGYGKREIAKIMRISEHTVKAYVDRAKLFYDAETLPVAVARHVERRWERDAIRKRRRRESQRRALGQLEWLS